MRTISSLNSILTIFYFYSNYTRKLSRALVFFQSVLFVKMVTKRRLEGSIIALKDDFEGWTLAGQCVRVRIFVLAFIVVYYKLRKCDL